jgi:hypothetical protein
MTRTLALEWGASGIRVNGVAPGPIRGTAGMAKLAPGASEEAVSKEIARTVPTGRMGVRSDIALACVYLSSKAADWVSGACPSPQSSNFVQVVAPVKQACALCEWSIWWSVFWRTHNVHDVLHNAPVQEREPAHCWHQVRATHRGASWRMKGLRPCTTVHGDVLQGMSWWWTVEHGSGESRLCLELLFLEPQGRSSLAAELSEQHAANCSSGNGTNRIGVHHCHVFARAHLPVEWPL